MYSIDDVDAERWSGHLGLVVVGVRMLIQCLPSYTDRMLQATLIFRDIPLVFRYEKVVLAIFIDFVLSM